MKVIIILLASLALSGCAGLSINADFTITGTYRSDVPLGERVK